MTESVVEVERVIEPEDIMLSIDDAVEKKRALEQGRPLSLPRSVPEQKPSMGFLSKLRYGLELYVHYEIPIRDLGIAFKRRNDLDVLLGPQYLGNEEVLKMYINGAGSVHFYDSADDWFGIQLKPAIQSPKSFRQLSYGLILSNDRRGLFAWFWEDTSVTKKRDRESRHSIKDSLVILKEEASANDIDAKEEHHERFMRRLHKATASVNKYPGGELLYREFTRRLYEATACVSLYFDQLLEARL